MTSLTPEDFERILSGDPEELGVHLQLIDRDLEIGGHLTAELLRTGFDFDGTRIPLVNPQRGIFKPRQMRFLLPILPLSVPVLSCLLLRCHLD
ncbi:MAG: hypothetical protein OXF74_00070 [Rhodobacteraceae bacterium]|nr:hypothetical protein [Paracoccaceae bacterium]